MEKKNKRQASKEFQGDLGLTKIKRINISRLTVDSRNANKGTDLGKSLLGTSVSKYGIGRGGLADKNLNMIAGNHSLQEIRDQGYTDVIIVPTDGNTFVITQRTDVDLNSKEGRELALADNRVTQANLSFDVDTINELDAEFNLDLADLAINMFEEGPMFPGSENESDAGEQMETRNATEYAGQEKDPNQITQNLFPVMAALSKAERLRFDSYKKSMKLSTDTETVIHMLKIVEKL